MEIGKVHANKGVKRNKKPLKNVIYNVELSQLKPDTDKSDYEQYKFKELGYLVLSWGLHPDRPLNWYGFIEPDKLKEILGQKQWGKFCQGKREFVIQRRYDKKNI
jgi:hypothetical protein